MEGGPGDAMIWRGSAFDCSTKNNEINLNFGRFSSAAGVCNNGSIQARSIMGVEYNLYTSQLNITVSSDMIGKTIECVHDNINNSTVSVVGTLTLATVGELYTAAINFIE